MMYVASIIVVHTKPEFDPSIMFIVMAVASAACIIPWLAYKG